MPMNRMFLFFPVRKIWCLYSTRMEADQKLPFLIMGRDLRVFLETKRIKNKQSCKADEIYCMRYRAPKKLDADLIGYRAITDTLGNLVAICPDCASIMNRRISLAKLKQNSAFMMITQTLAGLHITACVNPSVNRDFNLMVSIRLIHRRF